MQIWVDADACPKVIKDILYRAAERVQISLTLVANRPLRPPASPYIRAVQVPAGADVADARIIEQIHPDDLVITADIPLASAVIDKGGYALNPRGDFYTEENVRQYLSTRNFMDDLRGAGVITGGPPTFSKNDRKAFANQLDRFITSMLKK